MTRLSSGHRRNRDEKIILRTQKNDYRIAAICQIQFSRDPVFMRSGLMHPVQDKFSSSNFVQFRTVTKRKCMYITISQSCRLRKKHEYRIIFAKIKWRARHPREKVRRTAESICQSDTRIFYSRRSTKKWLSLRNCFAQKMTEH